MPANPQGPKPSFKSSLASSLAGSAATLDPTRPMPGAFYEAAMIIPGMERAAIPRRSAAPKPTPTSQPAAMASQTTLIGDGTSPAKDTDSVLSSESASRPNLAKRIIKRFS